VFVFIRQTSLLKECMHQIECRSSDGRPIHQYLYLRALGRHVQLPRRIDLVVITIFVDPRVDHQFSLSRTDSNCLDVVVGIQILQAGAEFEGDFSLHFWQLIDGLSQPLDRQASETERYMCADALVVVHKIVKVENKVFVLHFPRILIFRIYNQLLDVVNIGCPTKPAIEANHKVVSE